MEQKIKDGANYAVGAGAGFAAYKYVPKFLIKKPIRKLYLKQFHSISQLENDTFYKAAMDAYEKNSIKEKGIKIININPENVKEKTEKIIEQGNKESKERIEKTIQKRIERALKKGREYKEFKFEKKFNKWLDKFSNMMDNKLRKHIKEVAKGKNACYASNISSVILNKDKMGFSTFHEIGHGLNHKAGGLKLFNIRLANVLLFLGLPLILGVGLLKNKKKDGEETKGFWDKTTTFIKNNCGALAGVCFVPILIEEGLASKNGAKLAKDVLDNNMYKKLVKIQSTAYSSYIISFLLTMGFTTLAVKLRDKIVDSKPIK